MKQPCPPPDFSRFGDYLSSPEFFVKLSQSPLFTDSPNGEYLHWDKLRYKKLPDLDWGELGLKQILADKKKELWWFAIKCVRHSLYRSIAHCDKEGEPFVYATPDSVLRLLHEIDMRIGPGLATTEIETGKRYLTNSMIEESITSSQLEGAMTTREVAKEILKSNKGPQDISERMFVNNYRAIQFISGIATEPLTPAIVLKIQQIITEGTLKDPDAVGRLRQTDDIIVRSDTGGAKYVPPKANELKQRLTQLCKFANTEPTDRFLHPVVHAVILHFLLAYDHPFEDGNGRTARALFYYLLLKRGYHAIQYIPISRVLKDAPIQYAKAYLYTESDENDMTYFINHQLKVISKAIAEFFEYRETKQKEMEKLKQAIRSIRLREHLNDRQMAALSRAVRKPDAVFSIESHRHSHRIAYQSARTDLIKLVELGLFEQHQSGRAFVFMPAKRLRQRIRDASF